MWCIHLCCTTRRVRVCPHFYHFFFWKWTCCSCCRLHQETEGNMDQLIYVRHVDKLASEPPKIKNLAWRYEFARLWVPKGSDLNCDTTCVNCVTRVYLLFMLGCMFSFQGTTAVLAMSGTFHGRHWSMQVARGAMSWDSILQVKRTRQGPFSSYSKIKHDQYNYLST